MSSARKMMGFDSPTDQKVAIRIRDWSALKLAMWRSKVGWEIVAREAAEIIRRCLHAPGCPGASDDAEPCLKDCADREQRMSALVVLNATRLLAPFDARQPAREPYMAPSRELYAELVAELAATQAELDAFRAAADQAAADRVQPPPNEHPTLPPPARQLSHAAYAAELGEPDELGAPESPETQEEEPE